FIDSHPQTHEADQGAGHARGTMFRLALSESRASIGSCGGVRLMAAALLAAAVLPLLAVDASARVVCRVYTEGNQRVTEFCNEGYLCDLEARKCRPGPEARRELEAEKARRMAEDKRRNQELRE